jgi:hypothetical protein
VSTYHFLVEVDVERESGKFAGRDEISEKLAEAISEGVDNADLYGIGSDSSSTYLVESSESSYMEKKELRALYEKYDAAVIAELPGDAELRKTVKEQHLALRELQAANERMQQQIKLYEYESEDGKTDVYISERDGIIEKRTYLPDGNYDRVTFRIKDCEITIGLRENKTVLEVRNETMTAGRLGVFPRSGNEMHMKVVDRNE